MGFSQNDATRVLAVIDKRITDKVKSGAGIEVTYGVVSSIVGRLANVFLYNDTVPSEDFRITNGLMLKAGDRVRVSIDSRGQRWIDEAVPSTDSPRLGLDVGRGELSFGDGTADPTLALFTVPVTTGSPTDIGTNAAVSFYPNRTVTYPTVRVRTDGAVEWFSQFGSVGKLGYDASVAGGVLRASSLPLAASKGVITRVDGGAITASAPTDADGMLAVDASNGRLYFRYNGTWAYIAKTAGFVVPDYETVCPSCSKRLAVGDEVVGILNERQSDGALHGVWKHKVCP